MISEEIKFFIFFILKFIDKFIVNKNILNIIPNEFPNYTQINSSSIFPGVTINITTDVHSSYTYKIILPPILPRTIIHIHINVLRTA